MRVAQAFTEEAAASFGHEKLERGLAYIAKTPEDEKPRDIPLLKIRVPDDKGQLIEKAFSRASPELTTSLRQSVR